MTHENIRTNEKTLLQKAANRLLSMSVTGYVWKF